MSAIDSPFDNEEPSEATTPNRRIAAWFPDWRSIGQLWPVGVYFGACLLLAVNQATVWQFIEGKVGPWLGVRSNQVLGGTQFGQAMGVGCVLALIAGFCGQNAIRSLAIASLLAVAIFLTLMGFLWTPYSSLGDLFYAYNLPLMIFGTALPLLAARLFTGKFLSRQLQIVSAGRFSIDRLFQLTAVIACLIFFCRVPMQLHRLSYAQVSIYLPGLVLISATASAITVLPSVRWGFQAKTTWKSWLLMAVFSSAGIAVLCSTFSFFLGKWMTGASFGFSGTVIAILFFLVLYLSGVIALRLSGFRWAKATAVNQPAAHQGKAEGKFTGWAWMAGFLLIALSTNIPLRLLKSHEQAKFERGMQWIAEIRADGGDASWTGQGISQVKIPFKNSSDWIERLHEWPVLHNVSLSGTDIGDTEVESLIRSQPEIGMLDLSGTKITDRSLKLLAGAERLRNINLSRTELSATAIADFVSSVNLMRLTLALEDIQLEDEDFAKIYSPKVWDWKLAGNRLTEVSLLPLFQFGAESLDISRNPGSESVFRNPGIQVTPSWLKLDQVNIGDAGVANWIAKAPPQSVTLGKTAIGLEGLAKLFATCSSITFLEGSFDENFLAQLSPQVVPQSISFRGKAFSGNFLINWPALPVMLGFHDASFSDEQLSHLASRSNWNPKSLNLRGCPITDASLPILEKFQLRSIDLSNTQVSAEGLFRTSLPGARIWVDPNQFTFDELERLRQRHEIIAISYTDLGW